MTRTLTGARARQIRRRLHRAGKRNTVGPPPIRPMRELIDKAVRQQLADLRGYLGRIDTRRAQVLENIARLERRLEHKQP